MRAAQLVDGFGTVTSSRTIGRRINRGLSIHCGLHVLLLNHKTELRCLDATRGLSHLHGGVVATLEVLTLRLLEEDLRLTQLQVFRHAIERHREDE